MKRSGRWSTSNANSGSHPGNRCDRWCSAPCDAIRGTGKSYYTNPATETFDLQYSLSDRIRYYWAVPEVQASCDALLANLKSREIPLTLLSQYLPVQYAAVREGALANDPRELLLDAVGQVLRNYARACRAGEGRT